MAAEVPASEHENAARAAIEQAGAALAARRSDIPATFVAQLFARAVAEDVLCYSVTDLAGLAERAYDFLKERQPGTPKIRCETVALKESGVRKSVSVIEIVNDDMPFLFDSVMGELAERRLTVQLVAHPVFGVRRDGAKLAVLGAPDAAGSARESFIHIHLEPISDEAARADIVRALGEVLGEVRLAVQDWRAMLERANGIVADLKTNPPPLPVDEIAEAIQFLQWLLADNFTFLGVRNYTFDGNTLEPDLDSALGIMRSPELRVLKRGEELLEYTPEIMAFLKEPRLLIIAKANIHARVHRRVYLDYIGIKRFDASGNLVGEQRIVGLFTSTAYTRSAHSIPYLRRKIAERRSARRIRRPTAIPARRWPTCWSIFRATNCSRSTTTRSIVLRSPSCSSTSGRACACWRGATASTASCRCWCSCRAIATTAIFARRIGDYLSQRLRRGASRRSIRSSRKARWCACTSSSAAPAAATPDIDSAALERDVAAIVRSWTDGLSDALALVNPPERARALFDRYRDAFSHAFQDVYAPTVAASDIHVIEGLSEERPLGVDFHHRMHEQQRAVGLKIWSLARPLPLSERVPVLENMGFKVVDERTYQIEPKGDGACTVWFHDMLLERRDGAAIELDQGKARLEAAFLMVMRGLAENDGYNALTLAGGLGWRDVALIRTLSRFLRQIRVPYSQDYMWATLVKHYVVVDDIVELFYARFDPRPAAAEDRDAKQKTIVEGIEKELQNVQSLDEDRILRHFVNAVQSAIRTNFFQTDAEGQPKALIAVKFESGKITDMPLPRPLYEIFVYSPRVEGVHMRFGKVARGGIRWSDRPQDFRTEVLGLVKAQQVKNAVIVPVGAKGGFVPKHMPMGAPRDQVQAEGIATYKLFISTLLDITDNIRHDGTIIPPDCVVRHEGDDPYLVVAADKGTATFSDIANALSIEHDYWLGDAFASGGSAGYDHKAMGITARGAWEAVKRHFREMDVDIGVRRRSRRRRRRHVGRRVRQRHAARGHHAAPGGVRSPRHFHRSRSRSGKGFRRAQAAVRSAALELAGLRQDIDFSGWRGLSAFVQGDPAQRCGAEAVRRRRSRDAAGADEGDPEGASRSVVLRRHRHLCAFVAAKATRRPATAPTTPSASPAPSCAAR